jgi:hypothetical protein
MIDPVTSLAVDSVDLIDDQTKVTLSFVKPSGSIGGYYLYMSSTGLVYELIDTKIDATHPQEEDVNTYDIDGVTYFEHTLDSASTDGQLIYFKIVSVSTTRELSVDSSIVSAYTYPSKPENLFVKYNGIDVSLTWDSIDFTGNKNSTFLLYDIYRDYAIPITGTRYESTTDTLTNTSFTLGSFIWVFDIYKRSQWFGQVTTEGEFSLETTLLTHYSDTSSNYTFNLDNVKIFISSSNMSNIGSSSTGAFTDPDFEFDKYYIYGVRSTASGGRESSSVYYQCYTIDTTAAYPYLRSVENSSTGLLSNIYWRTLKDVLIDKSYYDKNAYAIPYAKDTVYNLKGYLGVADCKLDVFVNGVHNYVTSTGDYGEFEINYTFKKGTVELTFQARDIPNIKFSRKTAPYSIRTLNIYTWFSTMGQQFEEIENELDSLISDVSMEECRAAYFEDKFSPFIGFYRIGDESEDKFRAIASTVYQAYQYVAYDEALTMIFDVMKEYIPELDHYAIHYNEDLYHTQRTRYAFVISSTGICRGDYYYGVSSCKSNGEETPVSIIRIDRRWWPVSYYGVNVIMWDYMADAETYRIYRGTSSTGLYLMTSTGSNFFIDINGYVETSTGPLVYNFTDLVKPTNVVLYDAYGVNNLFLRLKKPNALVILLFGLADSTLEDYDTERILYLLSQFIPPELRYRVIFSNDSKIILYPEDENADPDLGVELT